MENIVSVIIVTFNAGSTLENAIKSILNQEYDNIELLIIDGQSTDNTLEIIEEYASIDNRIKFISEPDSGIYDAMNKGWKMASGEWILYLGADDELLPNGLKALIENSFNQDVVYGDTYLRFLNGKCKAQYAKQIINIKKTMVTSHQSLMMKKDVIKQMDGFNLKYKIIADYDLLLRCYLRGYKFAKSDAFISIFSLNGSSERNINRLIIERHKIISDNGSVQFPSIYTMYFFLKQNLAKLKHSTIDKF